MTVWEELKPVLEELERADALTQYPDPRVDDGRHPPFSIHLAAWALGHAAALHQRFGDAVRLEVGALRYPDPAPYQPREDLLVLPELDPSEARVALASPIEIRSGHSLHARLRVRTPGSEPLRIATNGQLTAAIVDPESARVVGGYTGPQPMPLVVFAVPPRGALDLPLLVGTQSFDPELGYAVPAGEWHLAAALRVAGHDPVRTPSLPVTIL